MHRYAVRERERERESVCERERDREREIKREFGHLLYTVTCV